MSYACSSLSAYADEGVRGLQLADEVVDAVLPCARGQPSELLVGLVRNPLEQPVRGERVAVAVALDVGLVQDLGRHLSGDDGEKVDAPRLADDLPEAVEERD